MAHTGGINKKQTKQMAIVIAVVVVAAAVIFGGGAFLFTQLFTGHIKAPSEYETVELKPDTYTATVTCDGTVKAAQTISVSPEIDGTVKSIKVEEGDKVKKGDLLMTLKNPAITKAEATAETTYSKAQEAQQKAQASYDSAKESLEDARKRKEKAVTAAKKAALKQAREEAAASAAAEAAAAEVTGEAATETDDTEAADASSQTDDAEELTLDDMDVTVDNSYDVAIEAAKGTAESAKTALEAAKSNTQNAKDAYDSAKERSALLNVTAEQGGTVLNLKAEVGMSTAMLNAQGAAMQISDLTNLLAVVEVPEDSISMVVRGQEAHVTSASLGDGVTIDATVSKVADTPIDAGDSADGEQPRYKTTLTLGKNSGAKVGMAVTAVIELQDFGTVYYIPDAAIREQEGASFVEVIYSDDTTAQRQVIVVGHTDDGQAVIDAGTLAANVKIRADLDE